MTTPSNSDMASMMHDLRELMTLLQQARSELAKRDNLIEKIRRYPYIPQGLARMIERELG